MWDGCRHWPHSVCLEHLGKETNRSVDPLLSDRGRRPHLPPDFPVAVLGVEVEFQCRAERLFEPVNSVSHQRSGFCLLITHPLRFLGLVLKPLTGY